jgi:hypothetical protein
MILREEIEIELKLMGSSLAGQSLKNVPGVPDDYFIQLEKQVLAEFMIQQTQSQEYFSLPDGYFEDLPDKLLDKYKTQKTGVYDFSLVELLKNSFFRGVAASMIIVLSVHFLLQIKQQPKVHLEVSLEASLEFIDHNLDDIELEELAAFGVLEEEDLSVVDHDENLIHILGESYMDFPDFYLESN